MADGTEPASAAGLAAAMGLSVAQSDAPVSAGNLKSLVDGGKIGAVDVLFRSEAGASSGTLARSADEYDLIVCVAHVGGNYEYWAASAGTPDVFALSGTASGSLAYKMAAPNPTMYNSATIEQPSNYSFTNIKGTSMSDNSMNGAVRVHLVIGIKTVGGGFS